MNTEERRKRNNAIVAFMGGYVYVKNKHFPKLSSQEFDEVSIDDLRFHESWDWLIPVWSKARFKLPPMAVINAITSIDEDKIHEVHLIISNACLQWCKENNIEL